MKNGKKHDCGIQEPEHETMRAACSSTPEAAPLATLYSIYNPYTA